MFQSSIDIYSRTVKGIGYRGKTQKDSTSKEYKIWFAILSRCYDENDKAFKFYGLKGIKVCDRWHCFANFVEDLPNVDGYNESDFYSGKIVLDKDIKQKYLPFNLMVYSPETCTFVNQTENLKNMNHESKKKAVIATDPEGKSLEFESIRELERQTNLYRIYIIQCLKGKRNTYKGWKFKYKKELI